MINYFNLAGNVLIAQRNVALGVDQVFPDEPQVHASTLRPTQVVH
ncbi:hypothetical protein [Bradyrhizobium japonicum]|nr:hypothetical protein [Bradyrhizobium japonicum]